jgi:hypothetical protein
VHPSAPQCITEIRGRGPGISIPKYLRDADGSGGYITRVAAMWDSPNLLDALYQAECIKMLSAEEGKKKRLH